MPDTINIGLVGPSGRMGAAFSAYAPQQPDLRISAVLQRGADLAQFLAGQIDVVVDLSLGSAVDSHGPAIVEAKLPYVVGATGYSSATLGRMRELAEAGGTPVLIVPNFSLGANLMIKAAAMAARLMQAPVITERHHMGKADAPSGTATFTAGRIADARRGLSLGRDSTAACFAEHMPSVLGGEQDGVAIHSLRGDGYLAEQSVQLTLPGESLTIEHRSIDRRCFMPGIAFAIRNIGRVQGLQIGLDTILEA